MIGNSLGRYKDITDDPLYAPFRETDRGYLLEFECEEEAKFLMTNHIFQKIMVNQNLHNC